MKEKETIKKMIKNNYRIYQPKMVMYSFKIDKELLNKAKRKARKLGVSTSVFVRQAILEKIENKNKLNKIEERLNNLEKRI